MVRVYAVSLTLAVVLLLSGCTFSISAYSAPVMPPQGLLFSNVRSVVDVDTESTPVDGLSGEASSIAILSLFAVGDASITTAARDAGINRVDHVEYEYFNVLGIFQQFTIIAYGRNEP